MALLLGAMSASGAPLKSVPSSIEKKIHAKMIQKAGPHKTFDWDSVYKMMSHDYHIFHETETPKAFTD